MDDLLRAARLLGLKARRVRSSAERLAHTPLPALAIMDGGDPALGDADDTGAVCLLAQCDGERVLVMSTGLASQALQAPCQLTPPKPMTPVSAPRRQPPSPARASNRWASFAARWTGELILVTSRAEHGR